MSPIEEKVTRLREIGRLIAGLSGESQILRRAVLDDLAGKKGVPEKEGDPVFEFLVEQTVVSVKYASKDDATVLFRDLEDMKGGEP